MKIIWAFSICLFVASASIAIAAEEPGRQQPLNPVLTAENQPNSGASRFQTGVFLLSLGALMGAGSLHWLYSTRKNIETQISERESFCETENCYTASTEIEIAEEPLLDQIEDLVQEQNTAVQKISQHEELLKTKINNTTSTILKILSIKF